MFQPHESHLMDFDKRIHKDLLSINCSYKCCKSVTLKRCLWVKVYASKDSSLKLLIEKTNEAIQKLNSFRLETAIHCAPHKEELDYFTEFSGYIFILIDKSEESTRQKVRDILGEPTWYSIVTSFFVQWPYVQIKEKYRVYKNLRKNCFSIQKKTKKGWRLLRHEERLCIVNPKFIVSEAGRLRVLRDGRKNVHAFIEGELRTNHPILPSNSRKISYNPYKYNSFYWSDSKQKITEELDMVVLNNDGAWAIKT